MAIVTKSCEWCGKEFQAREFPGNPGRSRFCSRSCLAKAIGQMRTQRNTISKCCPVCGREFQTRKSSHTHQYCSRKCADKAHSIRLRNRPSTKITLICESCGKSYQRSPCRRKDGEHHFCSPKCRGAYQTAQGVVEQSCAVCEKSYLVSRAQIRLRNSKYCSRECQAKVQAKKMQGANNPNWQGGIPPVKDYGPHWGAIKRRIRKRDNHTCQSCGITRKGLDVHHKIPLRFFLGPEFANHPDNLTTLCRACHLKADHAFAVDISLIPG